MATISFQHAKADLEWALSSPALIEYQLTNTKNALWEAAAYSEFIHSIDDQTGLGEAFSKTKNHRLGHYFERLINYYLTHSNKLVNSVRSIPLRNKKRTLGELDFLYQTSDSKNFTHLEIAVKFYLCLSDPEDTKNWIGMDPRDNFGAKIDRLFSHQLPIATSTEGKALLDQQGYQIEHSEAFIKGRLFYPWQDFHNNVFQYPREVNRSHLKGWWMRLADIEQLKEPNQFIYQIEKKFWLAELKGAHGKEQLAEMKPLELNVPFSLIQPIMVVRANVNSQEIDRGIIIPDQWPNI